MKEAFIHQPESYDASERAPLSEVKRKLLQKYLRGGAENAGGERALICPRPHDVAIPLSFAQQQIWLRGQMAGDVPFYNETMTVYRHGAHDLRSYSWRTRPDYSPSTPHDFAAPGGFTQAPGARTRDGSDAFGNRGCT